MPGESGAWRCRVCGYIHRGPDPPKVCPVCGAPSNRFEPFGEAREKTAEARRGPKAVVIGAGVAGIAAARSLREASHGAEITVVSNETRLPYYRLNLTRYLAGEIHEGDLPMQPEAWYREQAAG